MKRLFVLISMTVLVLTSRSSAQTPDPLRYELAVEFTSLSREQFNGVRGEPGLGVRFTFNFNKNVAIEGAGHVSFSSCSSCAQNGGIVDAFGGLKAGKRFKSWGIFAKARPGYVFFSEGKIDVIQTGTTGPFPFEFRSKGLDNFATDVGGVVEFYPSRRIVTRFDVGDTIIHFTQQTQNALSFDPTTGNYSIVPFLTPARTTNNFQFMASVGFRF